MPSNIFNRKIPTTLGARIDHLYKMRATRLDAARAVETMREKERALTEKILTDFPKSRLERAAGKLATATRSVVAMPTARDWPLFYAYVAKEDAWDLLQRRLNEGACRDRWAEGISIPGLDVFDRVSLSLRKR